MRQALILFADMDTVQPAGARALKAVTDQLAVWDGTGFIAYRDAQHSTQLRRIVGGPPPRFFPQAARPTLGERLAQAFAFTFVQGFERVVLMTRPDSNVQASDIQRWFVSLEAAVVHLEELGSAQVIALRREDFPTVAIIFESVAWEQSGAVKDASRLLALHGVQA